MKKGQKALLINHIIGFVVMSNSGHILIKGQDVPKTFDADFDGENVRKPQLTKTMKAAQGEAKKKAEAFIAKLVKDLNKKRHPNIGPVTPEHFYILEKRLKTSIGIKPKTRGEQEIDKANSLKSKRLTEKSAEAEK